MKKLRPWTALIQSFIKATDPCAGCEDEECANQRGFFCPSMPPNQEDDERVDKLFSERVRSKGLRRLTPDNTGKLREEDIQDT